LLLLILFFGSVLLIASCYLLAASGRQAHFQYHVQSPVSLRQQWLTGKAELLA
jgi:hypothetical protein